MAQTINGSLINVGKSGSILLYLNYLENSIIKKELSSMASWKSVPVKKKVKTLLQKLNIVQKIIVKNCL